METGAGAMPATWRNADAMPVQCRTNAGKMLELCWVGRMGNNKSCRSSTRCH
jgi:hypothetical protein